MVAVAVTVPAPLVLASGRRPSLRALPSVRRAVGQIAFELLPSFLCPWGHPCHGVRGTGAALSIWTRAIGGMGVLGLGGPHSGHFRYYSNCIDGNSQVYFLMETPMLMGAADVPLSARHFAGRGRLARRTVAGPRPCRGRRRARPGPPVSASTNCASLAATWSGRPAAEGVDEAVGDRLRPGSGPARATRSGRPGFPRGRHRSGPPRPPPLGTGNRRGPRAPHRLPAAIAVHAHQDQRHQVEIGRGPSGGPAPATIRAHDHST